MGLFDKVEKGLERTVNRAFAKAFKAQVAPVEIASTIRRAMDEKATALGPGHTMVPNSFSIELSPSDFERYDEYAVSISEDLVAAAQEHAETQSYVPGGPIEVHFALASDLDTGIFRVTATTPKRTGSPGPSAPDASAYARPPAARMPSAPAPAPAPASAAAPAPAPAPGPARPPEGAADGADPLAAFDPLAAPAASPDVLAAPDPLGAPAPAQAPAPAAPTSVPAAPAAPAPSPAPAQAPAQDPDRAYQRPQSPLPPVNPAQRPWLDIDGERYPLLGALTVVGRDATADIILDDPGISRRHSEVRITHDGPHLVSNLRDLASTNGTFLNGERITTSRLQDGDRITIGRTAIVFRAGRR